MIFAIDPGNEFSAYVLVDDNLKPIEFDKCANDMLLKKIFELFMIRDIKCHVAIEMVASYGMSVGKTVFDTCVWIGRFYEKIYSYTNIKPTFIYRKDEKMSLCHTMKAKDSNIVQALVDRFAPNTSNKGKGTKNNKGFFYGFKKDIWQAMAVAVSYNDIYIQVQGERLCQ